MPGHPLGARNPACCSGTQACRPPTYDPDPSLWVRPAGETLIRVSRAEGARGTDQVHYRLEWPLPDPFDRTQIGDRDRFSVYLRPLARLKPTHRSALVCSSSSRLPVQVSLQLSQCHTVVRELSSSTVRDEPWFSIGLPGRDTQLRGSNLDSIRTWNLAKNKI